MIILGKSNLNQLLEALIIPEVRVKTTQYWILPIYKVQILYMCKK